MEAAQSRWYFGNAWTSLTLTRNLFGKLCLLALIQFVPVLGQIVTLGYLLGWAREAAWGMDTPLPAHVFGRDDPGFWTRGAKAYAAQILYVLIACALAALLAAGEAAIVLNVSLSSAAYLAIHIAFCIVDLALFVMLAFIYAIGLMRLAVYDRFGAAFQWGACFKMLGHRFGGLVKIFFTYILAWLIVGILSLAVVLAFAPGMVGVGVGATFVGALVAFGESTTVSLDVFGGLGGSILLIWAGMAIAGFLLSVLCLMVEAVLWRTFGNWVALFDVPAWGGRFDPLPFQNTAPSADAPAPMEGGAADAQQTHDDAGTADADRPAAAPVEGDGISSGAASTTPTAASSGDTGAPAQNRARCHPLLMGFLCLLASLAIGGATSYGVLTIVEVTYGSALSAENIQDVADRAAAEIDRIVDEVANELTVTYTAV